MDDGWVSSPGEMYQVVVWGWDRSGRTLPFVTSLVVGLGPLNVVVDLNGSTETNRSNDSLATAPLW